MSQIKSKLLPIVAVFVTLLLTGCTMSWLRPNLQNIQKPAPPVRQISDDRPFEISKVDLAASQAELENFTRSMQSLIKNRDFAGLDEMAAKYRDSKERFIGGGWKIHSFYSMLSGPSTGDKEADWESYLVFLQDWKKARPSSIAARCSLVNAYIGFAWLARGDEYADKVPESAWPIIHERLDAAEAEFKGISNPELDPYGYFEVAEDLALRQGWDRNTFENIFSDAIKFDPTYQYFYTGKAIYLLPRWSGKPGEWEAFTEQTKNTIGGEDGLKMYYLIIADVTDNNGYNKREIYDSNHMSWADTRVGFQLYEKQYGMTRAKLNQFARMSVHAADGQAACKTFDQLTSDDFDPGTWKDRTVFEQEKMLAKQMCSMPKFNNQAQ